MIDNAHLSYISYDLEGKMCHRGSGAIKTPVCSDLSILYPSFTSVISSLNGDVCTAIEWPLVLSLLAFSHDVLTSYILEKYIFVVEHNTEKTTIQSK